MTIDADDYDTPDRGMVHPRSRIADVVLADAPAHLDADAVEAVLDATFSSTEAACLSSHHLLDWNEQHWVRIDEVYDYAGDCDA